MLEVMEYGRQTLSAPVLQVHAHDVERLSQPKGWPRAVAQMSGVWKEIHIAGGSWNRRQTIEQRTRRAKMTELQSRPEKDFRAGAVRVTVWANSRLSSEGIPFNSHKVALERTYKDSGGGFKTTGSLGLNDIPKAILALQKAYDFLISSPPRDEDFPPAHQESFQTPRRPLR